MSEIEEKLKKLGIIGNDLAIEKCIKNKKETQHNQNSSLKIENPKEDYDKLAKQKEIQRKRIVSPPSNFCELYQLNCCNIPQCVDRYASINVKDDLILFKLNKCKKCGNTIVEIIENNERTRYKGDKANEKFDELKGNLFKAMKYDYVNKSYISSDNRLT